jgi:hypothetical protein
MNCRAFHRKLEDYLQDGLDFSSRFGIERHAHRCISCGKDLADALELRRMAQDLKQVHAPADFEAVFLNKIGTNRAHGMFSGIRRMWVYGPEWLSWKNLMLASSSVAVLVLGIIVANHRAVLPPLQVSQRIIARPPDKVVEPENPVIIQEAILPKPDQFAAIAPRIYPLPIENKVPKTVAVPASFSNQEFGPLGGTRSLLKDYVDFGKIRKDIRPESVPLLPKKIWLQYYPASEEYFIQHVSH